MEAWKGADSIWNTIQQTDTQINRVSVQRVEVEEEEWPFCLRGECLVHFSILIMAALVKTQRQCRLYTVCSESIRIPLLSYVLMQNSDADTDSVYIIGCVGLLRDVSKVPHIHKDPCRYAIFSRPFPVVLKWGGFWGADLGDPKMVGSN